MEELEVKRIRIGRNYETQFNSIVGLFNNASIHWDNKLSVDPKTREISLVTDKKYIFTYDDSIIDFEATNQTSQTMKRDGASWFSFKNKENKQDDGSSTWISLIDQVANQYHKEYGFVEFKQQEDVSEQDKHLKHIQNFLHECFAHHKFATDQVRKNDKEIKDIFGLSLKMDVYLGAGATIPILCKVYFKKMDGEGLIPLKVSEANEINTQINRQLTSSLKEEDNKEIGNSLESDQIIDDLIDALTRLVKNTQKEMEKSLISFKDYMFCGEIDEERIKTLIGSQNNVEVICNNIKILGLFHVKWKENSYFLTYGSRAILKFDFATGNHLTVECLNCHETLIKNKDLSTAYTKEEKEICKKHLSTSFSCNHMHGGNPCHPPLICESQKIKINGHMYCSFCPYPEVLYHLEDGRICPTADLIFARDKMDMITKVDPSSKKQNYKRCDTCGRIFSLDNMKTHNECDFCRSLDNKLKKEEEVKKAKTLYKKYKNVLPLGVRLRHSLKAKYCFDDVDVLVFKLGNETFHLNLLEIDDMGYIPNPKKSK